MNFRNFLPCAVLISIAAIAATLSIWRTPEKAQPLNAQVPQPSASVESTPAADSEPSPTATPILPSTQEARDGKISNIKLVQFDSRTGEFREEIESNADEIDQDEDYSSSMSSLVLDSTLVIVGISSQAYFREVSESDSHKYIKVEITVTNNKQRIAKKMEEISLSAISEGGKIFVPVWTEERIWCGYMRINARIIGQKTASAMKRTWFWECPCTL